MSTENRSKPLETAAIIIGVLAIAASAYFIFMTDGAAYRLTNWIISLAFLVFRSIQLHQCAQFKR